MCCWEVQQCAGYVIALLCTRPPSAAAHAHVQQLTALLHTLAAGVLARVRHCIGRGSASVVHDNVSVDSGWPHGQSCPSATGVSVTVQLSAPSQARCLPQTALRAGSEDGARTAKIGAATRTCTVGTDRIEC